MPEETAQLTPNPNADSNFAHKQASMEDNARVEQFIYKAGTMEPRDRAAFLTQNGVSEDEYKQAVGEAQAGIEQGEHGQPFSGSSAAKPPGTEAQEYLLNAPGSVVTTALKGAGLKPEHAQMAGDLVNTALAGYGIVKGGVGLVKGAKGLLEEGEAAKGAGSAVETAKGALETGQKVNTAVSGASGLVDESGNPILPSAAAAAEGSATTAASSDVKAPAASAGAPPATGTTAAEPTPADLAAKRVFTQDYNDRYAAAVQEARRGTVSRETQQTVAQEHPATPEEIAKLTPGSTATAEKATAYTNFIRDEGETIKDLAGKALDKGDPDARAEALQRIDSLVSVHDPKVQGVVAETGRALGAFNEPTPAKYARQLRSEVLSKIGQPGYMTEDEVLNLFRGMKSPEEIEQVSKQIGNGGTWGWWKNFATNSYISGRLSVGGSVTKKAASDALNILYQPAARGLAEGAGYVQRAMGAAPASTVTPGEAGAMVRAITSNFRDAMSIGWKSAKENRPLFQEGVGYGESMPTHDISSAGTRFEGTAMGKALDWYGHILSVPGRGITGVDQAAKMFHYRMELAALAEHQGYTEATAKGLNGSDFAAYASGVAQKFKDTPPQWAIDHAFGASKIETFQRDLSGTLAGIDQLRQSSALVRCIVPFFRTGSNIVRMGAERLIPGSTEAYREAWQAGGRERSLMVAKNAIGDMMAAGFAHEFLKDNLTGYGPRNPDQRKIWMQDHQPYSVKLGDTWHSLSPYEPVAWQAGITADAADMMKHLSTHDALSLGDALTASTIREFTRMSVWEGASGFFQTMDELAKGGIDTKEARKTMGGLLGDAIMPEEFQHLGHVADPVRRQITGFMDSLAAKIPFLSKTAIPERNSWGQVMSPHPGFFASEFPAFATTKDTHDPVDREMNRLWYSIGYAPPKVPQAMGGPADPENPIAVPNYKDGVNLSPQLQDRWAELRGTVKNPANDMNLKDAVKTAMNDPKWNEASDPERAKVLNRLFTAYQNSARKQLLAEHPEIVGDVKNRKIMQRMMRATPGPAFDSSGMEGP